MISSSPSDAGMRLDAFLAARLPEMTRSRIKQLVDGNLVTVSSSGMALKCSSKIKGNEIFEITVPEARPIEAHPEELSIKIIYEDSDIVVVDKPAGMVVHPAAGNPDGTLVNAMLFHCKDLSGIGGMLRPGIVHRLDKGTSGVMLVTKNDTAHLEMASQFKKHTIDRKYQAIVYGRIEEKGTIDLPLGRNPRDRKKISVVEGGRRAITHWKRLASYQNLSFIELTLETGRTHQIRVHLSHSGHPVIGDPVYCSTRRLKEIKPTHLRNLVQALDRQALHACLLGFKHPRTGEYMKFTSALPPDISHILDELNEPGRDSP